MSKGRGIRTCDNSGGRPFWKRVDIDRWSPSYDAFDIIGKSVRSDVDRLVVFAVQKDGCSVLGGGDAKEVGPRGLIKDEYALHCRERYKK